LRLLSIVREICRSEKVADFIFRSDNHYLLKSIATDYQQNAAITNTYIRIMVEIISSKNKSISRQICTYEDVVYILHILQFYYKLSSTVIMSLCLFIQHQLNTRSYERFEKKLLVWCIKTVEHWSNSSKPGRSSVIHALNVIISMMES
jgi:hypothetical protein